MCVFSSGLSVRKAYDVKSIIPFHVDSVSRLSHYVSRYKFISVV